MHKYSFQLKHLSIPFKFSYEHNLANRSVTDSLVLILILNDIICVGETTPREYVTGEASDKMPALVEKYLPNVIRSFEPSISGLNDALQSIPASQTALKCLIESALLSYLVKSSNTNIFKLFNAEEDQTLQYTASITGGSEKAFKQMVTLASNNKMTDIKLKLTSSADQNLYRVNYLKQLCGDNCNIRMDGNEIWTFEDAKKQVPKLIEAGASCFEQLFHRDDMLSYDRAFTEWGDDCELIVDESVTDSDSANRLVKNGNVHGACLKISKNGGLIETLRIAEFLKQNGLSIRLGCHVGETSYLSLLGLVFASIANPIHLEGGLSPMLLDYDPFSPNVSFGKEGNLQINEEYRNRFGSDMSFQVSD